MSDAPEAPYVRPTWPARVFRDEHGNVIEYGNRWQDGPPDWAYGATTNLDRFSPLHQVAAALVEHIVRDYQVVVSEAREHARTLDPEPPDFVRLVRLDPGGTGGEPMTIVFTSFPGVVIYAGARFPEGFPACGCDACDDTVDELADSLEERVLALARDELGWSQRN
jgi:hypothetical protein